MDWSIMLFKQLAFSSASDFISTLDKLGSRAGYSSQLIWRGVGRSDYSLTPAAAREAQISLLDTISQLDTGNRLEIDGGARNGDQDALYAAYREWCALMHFCRNANRQALELPSWTPDSLHRSLALATDESFLKSNLGKLVNAITWWPPSGIWPAWSCPCLTGHPGVMVGLV